MGRIEDRVKKRRKKADLRRLVLQTVAMAGVLSVALVAPNVIVALRKTGILPGARQQETVRRSWQRCVEIGLLRKQDGRLLLTKKGERLLSVLNFKDVTKRVGLWDGRWRALVFDIPERRKHVRERIREFLRGMGFVRLQDSVWIIPYDCEDIVTLLKNEYYLHVEMIYMVVESMENDGKLRRHFNLA